MGDVFESQTRIIQNLVSRGVVTRVDAAKKMQMLVVEGLSDDTAEHFEPYGFSSKPHLGAEAIVLQVGGTSHPVVLVVADRRYRIKGMANGEVAIFDDQSQKVHITRAGIVVSVPAGKFVSVDAADVRLGTGADSALVRWADLKSFLEGMTLPVTNAMPLGPGPVTAGPPASVPGMGTSTVVAR